MKTVLMMIVAIGSAGAAQASGSASRMADATRSASVKASCERSDSEGFCRLTLINATRTRTAPSAIPSDHGRAQLDRLIASLR